MSMDQPQARSRGFSIRSDKSGSSKGKVDLGPLTESPEAKARRGALWKSGTKANPNAAINEAPPNILNQTEASTLESLRAGQHKDANGNVIVDPDLSNPTRPRLERPLDTIRSFEKAIDNGYKRRSSYRGGGGDTPFDQNNQFASRRSSYFGGNDNGPSPVRHNGNGGGYYGSQRPDGHQNGGRMRYGSRAQSDGNMNGHGRPYPPHGPHQSQDTMHTGMSNGSDSTGPWASGTEPSSENSSVDRNFAGGKQPESYGHNGYGPNNSYGSPPIMEERSGQAGGPVQEPRKPIALGNTAPGGSLPTNARPAPEEKKKGGFFKRRFSKKE